MEFGKLQNLQLLDEVKWDLPSTDPLAEPFLKQFAVQETKLRIGAPAWGHKEWVGKIYPLKTPATKYLYHYSRYFNTIELNTTHYRIPTLEQAQKWKAEVPLDFIFCPKVFQGISHEKTGLADSQLHKVWFQFMESLQTNCGPCFLQLPPHFTYEWKAVLFKFLQSWPKEFQLAIEFRHPSWFQDGKILPALTEYLQSRKIGLVILDVAGRRDLVHSSISSDFTMVRCIGNALHESDYHRATLWNNRLEVWEKQGLPNVYFFMHEPDDILLPEMMTHLKELPFFKSHFSPSDLKIESETANLKFFT